MTIQQIIVVGGGSAGFLAAITLKARLPHLSVRVIRSKEIGIIGVGEGSTIILPAHLHGYLSIDFREFYQLAEPQWKLGINFLWGRRPSFSYSFDWQFSPRYQGLSRNAAFYFAMGDSPLADTGEQAALMAQNKVFVRQQSGAPLLNPSIAYHLENEKFVHFLEDYAQRLGVEIIDDTIVEVMQNEQGVAGLRLASHPIQRADLYIDCSGFASLLLGKTFNEPFVSFKSSLFCDRAVVGGWAREQEPILPHTTAETMDSGWCWQIEHEHRINRGYVYSSAFISDDAAEQEFRRKNPKITTTRIVKFATGRYERTWVKNVVAIGNASGFVEPLESTSLSFICSESVFLAEALFDADMELRPTVRTLFNRRVGRGWDAIRQFLALHYRFNDRLDTAFWQACREKVDLVGAADVVEFYQANGPSVLWQRMLLDGDDQFGMEGYLAMLVGQQVPYQCSFTPTAEEQQQWAMLRQHFRAQAAVGLTAPQALAAVRSPYFSWPQNLYPKVCAPAPARRRA